MNRRNHFKPSKKLCLMIGTVLCISLFALSSKSDGAVRPLRNSVSSTITPVQTGVNQIGNWFIDHISFLSNIANIKKENDELREKVEQLDAKVSQMEKEETELKRLRELLEMSEEYSEYPSVGANVIGKGPGNWFNTLVIDKGEEDGIEEGMNVLSGDGLVGIVIEVQSKSAQVMAIIDDESNVSAMALKTGDICMVSGSEETIEQGYIGIEELDKNAKVEEGDKIITSNISSKYLPGLTIGTIKDIKVDDSKLSKTAKLEPAVDFKSLQEVLIIKKTKSELNSEGGSSNSKTGSSKNSTGSSTSSSKSSTGSSTGSSTKSSSSKRTGTNRTTEKKGE